MRPESQPYPVSLGSADYVFTSEQQATSVSALLLSTKKCGPVDTSLLEKTDLGRRL